MLRRNATGTDRAWIELDRAALRHNVDALCNRLPPGCALMPAVKADAYGHGAVPIARALQGWGVRDFCVASAQEGVALRRHGISGMILVLGYTHPTAFPLLRRWRLTQTVVDADYARTLNAYGKPLHVHIGIDTGMHRLGERCEDIGRIAALCRLDHLVIDGVYTHLCTSDDRTPQGRAFAAAQGQAFDRALHELAQQGIRPPKRHILSSYGLLRYPELGGDYARVGIALYGLLSTRADTDACPAGLRPVLSLKARVAATKRLHAGEGAGYGLRFVAGRDTTLAVIAIGYADGLPRALSDGKGRVLLHGRPAPIVGQVCMDQTLVDVTDIPGVRAGDTAVVIGRDGDQTIRADAIAEEAGTITNEVLSRLGARLPRLMR